MNVHTVLVASLLAVSINFGNQSDERCMTKAWKAVDAAKSWRDLRTWFETYADCDDGVVAEGVSDKVAQWLAKDWRSLPNLRKELCRDPRLKSSFSSTSTRATIQMTYETLSITRRSVAHTAQSRSATPSLPVRELPFVSSRSDESRHFAALAA